MDTLIGLVVLGFVVLFFGGLIYVCLFDAKSFNYPNAARGLGLFLLAGALKLLFLLGAESLPALNSEVANYGLGALALMGALVMMSGFGEG